MRHRTGIASPSPGLAHGLACGLGRSFRDHRPFVRARCRRRWPPSRPCHPSPAPLIRVCWRLRFRLRCFGHPTVRSPTRTGGVARGRYGWRFRLLRLPQPAQGRGSCGRQPASRAAGISCGRAATYCSRPLRVDDRQPSQCGSLASEAAPVTGQRSCSDHALRQLIVTTTTWRRAAAPPAYSWLSRLRPIALTCAWPFRSPSTVRQVAGRAASRRRCGVAVRMCGRPPSRD